MKLDHTRDILKTYCDENNADVTDTSSIDLFKYISWLERRAAAAPDMLEGLIYSYKMMCKYCNAVESYCKGQYSCNEKTKRAKLIESATGKKIEEVIGNNGKWIIEDVDCNAWRCPICNFVWIFNNCGPKENQAYYCQRCGEHLIEHDDKVPQNRNGEAHHG